MFRRSLARECSASSVLFRQFSLPFWAAEYEQAQQNEHRHRNGDPQSRNDKGDHLADRRRNTRCREVRDFHSDESP